METPKLKKRGSRQDVFEGLAAMTAGGLTKADLLYNERTGKIITLSERARGQRMRDALRPKAAADDTELPARGPPLERTTSELPPERPKKAPRKPRAKKTKEAQPEEDPDLIVF